MKISHLAIFLSCLVIANPASAAEFTRAQADKLSQIQARCAAYYKAGVKDFELAEIFTKSASELIEVYAPVKQAEARSRVEQTIATFIAQANEAVGGNFEDERIPTRFKTYRAAYFGRFKPLRKT